MEGDASLRRSSSNDDGKFREAMAMASSFLQVEEMYPDQKKTLRAFLKKVVFSSARTQSISDPSSDLKTKIRSVYKLGKKRTAAGFRKQY